MRHVGGGLAGGQDIERQMAEAGSGRLCLWGVALLEM